ncbi:unnamed protein product [Sphenostylis stenocarpa]|uniref:WRKY domain-containing protein n=1 Tax=Sphenostylis stenocarpa TaxID=92480 RepID=A0AA86T0Q1_9FABA|nr:unnamed protein product [Sphenostylis stenocarpa]
MSALSPPTTSATSKRVVTKLVQGLGYATQLKFLLQNPNGPDGSVSAKELLNNVQRSFAETISVLTSSEAASVEEEIAQNLVISGEDASQVESIDPRSEGSTESRRRSLPLSRDRRGSYKRSQQTLFVGELGGGAERIWRIGTKTEQTWTIVSKTTDDNHAWRKYGQKDILNSQFPRSYFRCTRKFEQGCKATKQVQRLQENTDMFNITYIGFHTCKDTLKALQMVTYSETWDSFLENSHPDSNVPNEQQQHSPPIRSQSPIVKQEYPNHDETDPSDLTDSNLWSDLKDFELPNDKPSLKIASENADTVFSCTGLSESGNGFWDCKSWKFLSNSIILYGNYIEFHSVSSSKTTFLVRI